MSSSRDRDILEFIEQFRAKQGYAPTLREISNGCDIPSTSNVSYWLDRLQWDGRIKRYRGVARGIVLT